MAVVLTAIGILLIGAGLIDVFQTLFHPAGRGALSDWTARTVWTALRFAASRHPGVLTYAGPIAILSIICSWAGCTLLGFALVYLPHVGSEYVFAAGVNPANHRGFWEALRSSVGALITLTEGIQVKSAWAGLLWALEAIIGFGLLTASVSWLLSIYPVLENRRSVAQRAALLHHAEEKNHIDLIVDCGDDAHEWIMKLAADLASLRNQMAQFPISYYFYVGEPQTALAGALPYLYELSERGARASNPSLRVAATALGGAVEDFLALLADVFLRMPGHDPKAVLRAYSHEQMSEMMA
jgi:hypothetical protein